MSGNVKGTRKSKNTPDRGSSSTGKIQWKPELIISILVAGVYALFLLESRVEGGSNGLWLSAFLFLAILVYAYVTRSSAVQGHRQFRSLVYVYLGLAALSMVWELLLYFDVINLSGITTTTWAAVTGVIYAIVSIVIIAAIVYFENVRLDSIFVRIGDLKIVGFGIIGFVVCIILGIGAAHFVFAGPTLGQDKLLQLAASVIAFAILAGVTEELWFRGLLLSRITPLLGESQGNVYQAAVFGVFETVMFYTLTGDAVFLPVMFIIGAMMGYYWGMTTLKYKSLAAPMLLHAGFYIIIALPLLAGLLS